MCFCLTFVPGVCLCNYAQEWESQVKILAFMEEERKPVRFGTWTAHDVEVRKVNSIGTLCTVLNGVFHLF